MKEGGWSINMNTRLEQVEFLFSYIFRKSLSSSRKIILSTSCGKRIQANAPDILFDQPTANLKELVMELEKEGAYRIDYTRNTNKRLINAYKKLCENEKQSFYSAPLTYSAVDENVRKRAFSKIEKKQKNMKQKITENRKQEIALAKFIRRSDI